MVIHSVLGIRIVPSTFACKPSQQVQNFASQTSAYRCSDGNCGDDNRGSDSGSGLLGLLAGVGLTSLAAVAGLFALGSNRRVSNLSKAHNEALGNSKFELKFTLEDEKSPDSKSSGNEIYRLIQFPIGEDSNQQKTVWALVDPENPSKLHPKCKNPLQHINDKGEFEVYALPEGWEVGMEIPVDLVAASMPFQIDPKTGKVLIPENALFADPGSNLKTAIDAINQQLQSGVNLLNSLLESFFRPKESAVRS
ncbi:MAG: hypothetical protein SFT81_01620 [Candidatus Caenarcaniphilales bacterium]|nr:hypothetical protein [Candidatus Caenarcaniphilales bacterium]